MLRNRRRSNTQLREQLRATECSLALLGHGDHAQALALVDVRQQQKMLLRDQPCERTTDRMTAGRTEAGGQFQDVTAVLQRTVDGLQAQGAKCQRAGFIHH
ncbi:hypothetical protein D3C85_1294400 [compost metagenome]